MPTTLTTSDSFLTFEAATTSIATMLFPLAGMIPGLKGFYLDEERRETVTTFAFTFSFAAVLYCRSKGVELVNAPSWRLAMGLALIFWLLYWGVVTYCKAVDFPKNMSPRKRTLVVTGSSVVFVIFFFLLSYSFNNLGLLRFSNFSMSGRVYVIDSANTPTAAKSPIKVTLKGANGFLLETTTDDEGSYEFNLNLSQLFATQNLVAVDPTGRYKASTYTLPGQVYGSLKHSFFLRLQPKSEEQ